LLRSCQGTPADEAVDFAFAHTEELARLLHSNGHREVAALLDTIGDVGELARRRSARGGGKSLIGPGSETLDYVLAQMSELAEMMTRHGVHGAALLFRMPGQLRVASEAGRLVAGASSMAA
jgi:hypothetical protein